MFFKGFGQMIVTAREDLDDWRRLRRRVKCPNCGELAWNDDDGAHCPYCQWDSNDSFGPSQRIKCSNCGKTAWSDDHGSYCPYCGWGSGQRIKCPNCGKPAWTLDDGSFCSYCQWDSHNPLKLARDAP